MKIAQVSCVYPPYKGGIGKIAADLTSNLLARGHQVTVFTPLFKFDDAKSEKHVKRLKPFLKLGNGSFLPQIFFNLNKYDIVYLHYPFFGSAEIVFLCKVLFRREFKLVVHYHMDTTELGFFKKVFSLPSFFIKKYLFRVADLIVCASVDYIKASQISDIYSKMSSKFIEIPFSIDIDRFTPKEKYNDENINISFVGGMDKAHNFKGIDILLSAFAKIEQKNIRLNLIGNGELIQGYRQLAKNLNIENKVIFFSKINDDEKISKYQETDIFVLPSTNSHEAFGIVLLEAMSCGVPVIASDLPGVRKVFENKRQGLLIEPKNVDDLKEKLEELIFDKEKRKTMGSEARILVENRYDAKKLDKKIEDCLIKLLS